MSAESIIDALVAADDERPRTKAGFGVSGLGGCARKAYHQMRHDDPANPSVKRLPAILGTAIHAALEKAADRLPNALAEVALFVEEVELAGTADLIRGGVLDDYKTTTLKNLRWIKSHGPSRNHRWQVMTYAYAWNAEQPGPRGQEKPLIHMVRLIYIPRDGDESDVLVWEEDYDEAVALEAIEWAASARRAVADEAPPAPEKHFSYCANWCQFYGLCPGLDTSDALEEVDDPWLADAAEGLLVAQEDIREAEGRKEGAKDALDGFTGIVGDFRVTWQRHRYGYYPKVTRIRGGGDER
ncbi:CRISPR-associated protein Cas4 [Streptomyces mirabilis]|uniref:CRISPR-associated protein Cas4 n=1 Tax=Streptomyces mirabilis TaxID=68239 RepID=UPI0036CD2874